MGKPRGLITVFEDSLSVPIVERARGNLFWRATPETTERPAGLLSTQDDGRRELARDLGGAGCQTALIEGQVKALHYQRPRLAPIPMFDRGDHSSVPTCRCQRVAAAGGQGWPQATASAARSVLEGRSLLREARYRRGVHRTRFPLPLPDAPTLNGKRNPEAHQKACSKQHQFARSCSLCAQAQSRPWCRRRDVEGLRGRP